MLQNSSSLYEMLFGNFTGDLSLERVSEEDQEKITTGKAGCSAFPGQGSAQRAVQMGH